MPENIIITDKDKLVFKKNKIKEGGIKKLHILTDFDRTLTRSCINGKIFPSIISILRDEDYLDKNYGFKSQELYNKYRPAEINPNISYEEKKEIMQEWWIKHFELLINSGLTKEILNRVAESGKLIFREGIDTFFNFLQKKNIPVVIMSSSGLGEEIIHLLLEKNGLLNNNIQIISNIFEWDNNGNLIGVKEPIIHSLNKREVIIKDYPFFEIIKDRKNVILIGDNAEDIEMIKGFDYDNLITVGFLNENVDENLEKHKQHYDIVLLNDPDMNYVNDLLKEVLE